MKILIIGGAGYVGGIVRPALEAEHDCYYYDRRAIPDYPKKRMFVGDVTDEKLARRAVRGMDAIIYMAMGTVGKQMSRTGHRADIHDIAIAFAVNAAGFYNFAQKGLEAGARKFIFTSSLSAFSNEARHRRFHEDLPADAWHPYGMSKRCGELVCDAIAQQQPKATVLALRIYAPRNAENFAAIEQPRNGHLPILGPHDTQQLFLKSLACKKRGSHVLHATGEVEQRLYKHGRARRLIGWVAEGR